MWFVSDLVDALDLTPIEAYYETETRGQPPYHPRLMVKLLVYGYCQGVRASRKVAERLDEDVAFRALAVSVVGHGEGAGRMGADLPDAQRLEDAPAGDGVKRC